MTFERFILENNIPGAAVYYSFDRFILSFTLIRLKMERFQALNESEINNILEKKDSKHTKYMKNLAAKLFNDFTSFNNMSVSLESLPDILSKFYPSIRQKNGSKYKKGSLITIRHCLNRHLKERFGENLDILNNTQFNHANKIFQAFLSDLKANGLGATEHYSQISQHDLKSIPEKLMSSISPERLQLLIFFYLHLYLCKRGAENVADQKKTDFSIFSDDSAHEFIKQSRDEKNKNHSEFDNEESIGGRIFATKSKLCPVINFKLLLSKLNPKCPYLWQKPKLVSNFDVNPIWFENRKLGHNSISKFMKRISEICELSRIYTNHCLRVTSVSVLGENGYSDIDIQSVSGHKSLNSLGVYKRTSELTKKQMSNSISNTLGLDNCELLSDAFNDGFDEVLAQCLPENVNNLDDIISGCLELEAEVKNKQNSINSVCSAEIKNNSNSISTVSSKNTFNLTNCNVNIYNS